MRLHFSAGKSGQNLDMYTPPGEIGIVARHLVSVVCYFVILYGYQVLRYLQCEIYMYVTELEYVVPRCMLVSK